ncbi:MAG: arginyl-tRNA synthetase, partial [Thermoleophilaceae bacterium]|nr:arginyl-tRNA synthetase [Thermoleophilaceae bacterium]
MPENPLNALRDAIASAAESLGGSLATAPKLERPPRPDFGDYSTNAAMMLAPALGEQPRVIAERLGEALREQLGASVERVEVAGPGFLNLFMSDDWYRGALVQMDTQGSGWGGGNADPKER